MDIDSNYNAARAGGASPARRSGRATKVLSDGSLLSQYPALQQTLNDLPASRPEAVARARKLIADPDYPPDYLEHILAQHLAVQLSSETGRLPSK
jgi:hypothetical protein